MEPIVEGGGPTRLALAATLREVIEPLASLERSPCSPGEHDAARQIAVRLRASGIADVALEQEPSWGAFQPQVAALGALGALLGRRRAAAACALVSAAGVVDEAQNGPRLLRRLVRRRRTTVNVVARAGDRDGARTLVVLAHHDAAQTGLFYNQHLVIRLHRRWPRLIARVKTQPPQWWLGLMAPVFAHHARRPPARTGARGHRARRARHRARRRHVAQPDRSGRQRQPLRGGALVALAELLREVPQAGLRAWLVSCGAEETSRTNPRRSSPRTVTSSTLDPRGS